MFSMVAEAPGRRELAEVFKLKQDDPTPQERVAPPPAAAEPVYGCSVEYNSDGVTWTHYERMPRQPDGVTSETVMKSILGPMTAANQLVDPGWREDGRPSYSRACDGTPSSKTVEWDDVDAELVY